MESKSRYDRQEVMAIPEPIFTKTWHPVSHRRVIQAVDVALESAGIGVLSETYSVKNNGKNMFAGWTLDFATSEGRHPQIGFRNSLAKTFAVGMCSGDFVVVCSNMSFSGEFIDFAKHTNGLDDDRLIELATEATNNVTQKAIEYDLWHRNLREIEVPTDDFKVLTFDAMKSGLIGPNRFNAFLDDYEAERKLNGDSLYSFHGGVTRRIRDINLFSISHRTKLLNGMCDDYTVAKAA